MFQKSDSISNLTAALVSVQRELKGAKKTTTNTFFKAKYATLEDVWETCRELLANNGIAVVQTPTNQVIPSADGPLNFVGLTTLLSHASGEWMSDTVYCRAKDDGAQAAGSVISYLRRYTLAAAVGVVMVDDDAESAAARPAAAIAAARATAANPANQAKNNSTIAEAVYHDKIKPAPSMVLTEAHKEVGKQLTRMKFTTEQCKTWLNARYSVERVSLLSEWQAKDAAEFLADMKPIGSAAKED